MEVSNPFGIFPKEVWEMILDKVEDSKDIQNVLWGFPKLDISIDKRKRFWYLDLILRFVCEWVEVKDILNLRLVCKQWEAKVNSFLQNQPYDRPYSHELHKDDPNFWNYIWNRKLLLFGINFLQISRFTDISVFENIKNHPQGRNPYVCRELIIYLRGGGNVGSNPAFKMYLERVFSLLRHSGVHLWNLDLEFEYKEKAFSAPVEAALEILKLIPNLKFLYIAGQEFDTSSYSERASLICSAEEALKLERNFPELHLLESLKITGFFVGLKNSFWLYFIKRYGKQIRRLDMDLVDWNAGYGNYFPFLTELRLGGIYKNPAEVTEMLTSFVFCANIVKVVLNLSCGRSLDVNVERSILKWIKLFPKIKYFGITVYKNPEYRRFDFVEDGTADPIMHCIPTLENLEIVDGTRLSYNFLRCFPSLLHLRIHYKTGITRVNHCSVVDLKEVMVRNMKIYESNVWEHLRKLRTVRFFDGLKIERMGFDFNRDTYQKLKNAGKVGKEHHIQEKTN